MARIRTALARLIRRLRDLPARRVLGVFAALVAKVWRATEPSTGGAIELAVVKFRDDENGYLDWVRRNSNGWVINAGRNFAPSDRLVLHSATCGAITTIGNHTTGDYIKVCSTDRAALMAWARCVEWVRSDADISTGCPFCPP